LKENAMRRVLALAILACAAVATTAAAAGSAEVRFVEPQKFTDAGFGAVETGRTTGELAEHLKRLAARLPEGQTLKIDVLDIDLAGSVEHRAARDIRVLRGRADWPRIELRYELVADGRTLKGGSEHLADMNYLWNAGAPGMQGNLSHEERMLSRWFDDTFGKPTRTALQR
jgi:hypothetical protein